MSDLVCQRRAKLTTALSPDFLHPAQVASRLFDAAKVKHQKRGLGFTLSFETVLAGVEAGACPLTGIEFDHRQGQWLPWRASLDRLDNTKGYHDDNVAVVTKIVNNAKGPWALSDFDRMCIARCKVLGLIPTNNPDLTRP